MQMKLIPILCTLFGLMSFWLRAGQEPGDSGHLPQAVTWKIDNLQEIGGMPTTILGHPQVIDAGGTKAVQFNGEGDALLVGTNPVAGWHAFTEEAIFRPEAGGQPQERWLHIQEATGDNRVLLELRIAGDEWFLDSFIKSGENRRTLYDENFKHPIGPWYRVELVYDGKEMRDYVDGKQELSGPLTITPLVQGKTSIGVRMNRVNWFKGAIREVRFTPRALSPDEFLPVR